MIMQKLRLHEGHDCTKGPKMQGRQTKQTKNVILSTCPLASHLPWSKSNLFLFHVCIIICVYNAYELIVNTCLIILCKISDCITYCTCIHVWVALKVQSLGSGTKLHVQCCVFVIYADSQIVKSYALLARSCRSRFANFWHCFINVKPWLHDTIRRGKNISKDLLGKGNPHILVSHQWVQLRAC